MNSIEKALEIRDRIQKRLERRLDAECERLSTLTERVKPAQHWAVFLLQPSSGCGAKNEVSGDRVEYPITITVHSSSAGYYCDWGIYNPGNTQYSKRSRNEIYFGEFYKKSCYELLRAEKAVPIVVEQIEDYLLEAVAGFVKSSYKITENPLPALRRRGFDVSFDRAGQTVTIKI